MLDTTRRIEMAFSDFGRDTNWDSERYGPAVPDNPVFVARLADMPDGTLFDHVVEEETQNSS